MRYPIYVFYDPVHLVVFDAPDQHWGFLEEESLASIWTVLDSDGRVLTLRDGETRVEVADSGVEPDPERLGSMLTHALSSRGQEWGDDPASEDLAAAARSEWGYENIGVPARDLFDRVLKRLHLRRPS
jgi:hypothetical protein